MPNLRQKKKKKLYGQLSEHLLIILDKWFLLPVLVHRDAVNLQRLWQKANHALLTLCPRAKDSPHEHYSFNERHAKGKILPALVASSPP